MYWLPNGPIRFNQNAVPSWQFAVRVLHFLIGHTMHWGGCVLGTRLARGAYGEIWPAAMVDLHGFVMKGRSDYGIHPLSRKCKNS